MRLYREWAPTTYDARGLALPDRQGWGVLLTRTRDSDALTLSNFRTALSRLGGEGEDVEIHRFGHWACGWLEILIVNLDSDAGREAIRIEREIDDYPILSEDDFSTLEMEHANEAWANCYSVADRLSYIRRNRSEFEFQGFADLLGCVRGRYFAGDAGHLLR